MSSSVSVVGVRGCGEMHSSAVWGCYCNLHSQVASLPYMVSGQPCCRCCPALMSVTNLVASADSCSLLEERMRLRRAWSFMMPVLPALHRQGAYE